MNGICLFTGLLPSTTYAVVTTGKANELQANGAIVARSVAKDAPFTTAVAPDTTPPVLQSASIQGGELVTGSPII